MTLSAQIFQWDSEHAVRPHPPDFQLHLKKTIYVLASPYADILQKKKNVEGLVSLPYILSALQLLQLQGIRACFRYAYNSHRPGI